MADNAAETVIANIKRTLKEFNERWEREFGGWVLWSSLTPEVQEGLLQGTSYVSLNPNTMVRFVNTSESLDGITRGTMEMKWIFAAGEVRC